MGHFHDETEHDHIPWRFEGAPGHGSEIVVTAAKRRWLSERWTRQWRRPPSPDQLENMVEEFVREEVLYREALELGLDREDLVVRRRLVQKMETLALGDDNDFGPSEVMRYFLGHRERYRLPERVSFSYMFFSSAARGDRAQADAGMALSALIQAHTSDPTGFGDAPITPSPVIGMTSAQVGERFGSEFADAVFDLPRGRWSAPIASAYGYHLVWVTAHADARLPELDEVSAQVAADLDVERRVDALDKLYGRLRPKYHVVVEETDHEHANTANA
jgi:peptidyl-prolyl cis-trans isomerase C